MNFLAHIYLSGADNELMIGNFIADALRGKQTEVYSEAIKSGIKLHRQIDEYTDNHDLVKQCYELLKPSQGRYAGVIVDISFDHFLAKNWNNYHPVDLSIFSTSIYDVMDANYDILPLRFQKMMPKMRKQNWLYQYQYLEGIQKAFESIAKRATFDSNMATAVENVKEHYSELEHNFEVFFEDLKQFVKGKGVALVAHK